MVVAWPHGIVKSIYEWAWCGGETEGEHKKESKRSLAHQSPAMDSSELTARMLPFLFICCMFYDVNNAAPSTPHPFSFTVRTSKLKEKASFAETRNPLSPRPELLSLGEVKSTSQSRRSTMRIGSGETAALSSQQPVQTHFPSVISVPCSDRRAREPCLPMR